VTTVAVVEDDPLILAAVTRGLTERGHVVSGATTGLGALGEIVDQRPDVVVLDLGLPDIDGVELLRMLRAVTNVPVIVATARDDERDIIRTLDAPLPEHCPHYGEGIDFERWAEQFQTELPEVKPVVTRFRVGVGRCRGCRRRVQGHHPEQTSDALGAAASQAMVSWGACCTTPSA